MLPTKLFSDGSDTIGISYQHCLTCKSTEVFSEGQCRDRSVCDNTIRQCKKLVSCETGDGCNNLCPDGTTEKQLQETPCTINCQDQYFCPGETRQHSTGVCVQNCNEPNCK